jgi:hypothetical protein
VIGFGRFRKPQNDFHHFLHLFFIRFGHAGHSELDRVGSEFPYMQAVLGKGGKNRPAGLGYRNRA